MTSTKKALIIGGGVMFAAAFAYLLFGGIGNNLVYFLTPSELLAKGPAAYDTPVRLGGQVVPGSVVWDAPNVDLRFTMQDGKAQVMRALARRAAADVPRWDRGGGRRQIFGEGHLRGDESPREALERVQAAEGWAGSVGDVQVAHEGRRVMLNAIGSSALIVALAISVLGLVAAAAGGVRRNAAFVRAAYAAAYVNFALLAIAAGTMITALVTHDFSVSYVAQVGSRSTPMLYTVISLWGALEGSILLWGLVLTGYTAAVVYLNRGRAGQLLPFATATLFGIATFFLILLVGPANPFHTVFPVPPDGPGPNVLLQNHPLMAIHPPFLYLGYVGMSVPFAFAIGALLSGETDGDWIRTTRRWTMVAWGFLGFAIVAGMWWSYDVLGWGGYWAWDPVENASFMPWLTATAFIHSEIVEERRGMLRVWNMTLIVATFILTILGTFLTRSGILSSVHAFAEGVVGYYFLGFIALVLIGSMILLAGRSNSLKSTGQLDAIASRETVFLFNNLLLCGFMFTVLLGTLFPLVAEAIRGVKVSVGAPFFNTMTLPIVAALAAAHGRGAGAAVAERDEGAGAAPADPANGDHGDRDRRQSRGRAPPAVRDRGVRVRRVRDHGEPARVLARRAGAHARAGGELLRRARATRAGEPTALRRLPRASRRAHPRARRDREQRVPHGA